MKVEFKNVGKLILLGTALTISACSSKPKEEPYFPLPPQVRQLPPEPVYNQLTWSHLPQPTPVASNTERARIMSPVLHLDLKDVSLKEAIGALAQTIGYQATVPDDVAEKRVTVSTQGTAERLLSDISSNADVRAELDRQNRVIRVYSPYNPNYQDGMQRW